SCDTDNNNIYDFRMVDTFGDTPSLVMLLREENTPGRTHSVLIYDNNYDQTHKITELPHINGHEINIKSSSQALAMISRDDPLDTSSVGKPGGQATVSTGGFVEFDITTGKTSQEWHSGDAISLDESFTYPNSDYIHTNSADRNQHGDYLLSGRHTDAIYLISGKDGQIIWRLGGKKNDFKKDFEFAGQHDAKFISVNDTHQVLSFLNNGARDDVVKQPVSSAMYVELNTVNMTATILKQYTRPDGGSTNKRGNVQTLPNNNTLVSWSMNGYMSEFTPDGKLLMDASFASDRFSTYRAYKFPWTSRSPSSPPTLVSSCYGVNGSDLSTVFYVSWNGATEVKRWKFYARADASGPDIEIGSTSKNGFETSYTVRGYMDRVSVKALDASNKVLKTSDIVRTDPPEYWPEGAEMPEPDDPSVQDLDYDETIEQVQEQVQGYQVGFFAIGLLVSTAGYFFLHFCYPTLREYVRRTYSKAQTEDPEGKDPEEEELMRERTDV
ncbi:uncharacterized protein PFLUO_LOCUS6992, partial [Penicillium psychrofluorescens]|uniref:uncharacterized protein n=1 Tax=Penicillium psychrofluorescens TaxID=3158075 RepID=UPI003CCD723C